MDKTRDKENKESVTLFRAKDCFDLFLSMDDSK